MTLEIASRVKNAFRQEVLAHLTCVGSTKEDIAEILHDFKREGIENIMALRGDPPKGETDSAAPKAASAMPTSSSNSCGNRTSSASEWPATRKATRKRPASMSTLTT